MVRLAFPGAAAASTEARDLNNRNNLVGTYRGANDVTFGFYYDHVSRTYRCLGAGVTVSGINDSNELVGVDDVLHCGLYWSSPTGPAKQLLPLAGHTHARAHMINDSGVIVGSSYIPENAPVTPGYRAIVAWRVDEFGAVAGPLVLPFPEGDLRGIATDLTEAVDDVTIIVGSTGDSTTAPGRAVQWSVEVNGLGELSLLEGPIELNGDSAEAYGINAQHEVVGRAVFTLDRPAWPFLKPAGLPAIPLAGISKATSGIANACNDSGRIVGSQAYLSRGEVRRAVLWTSPSKVVDLNSLVTLSRSESLTAALRINNAGHILAINNGNTSCLLIAR